MTDLPERDDEEPEDWTPPLVPDMTIRMVPEQRALDAERDEERKAHDRIATLCFAEGGASSDGTSIAAVRSIIGLLEDTEGDRETLYGHLAALRREREGKDETC